ncbi:MAG: hypothetical protein ACI97A_001039 [Planctomycetota bacterium]
MIVRVFGDDDFGDQSGSARVFSGLGGSTFCTFFGNSVGDIFGANGSGAGDIKNDGLADVIVSADYDATNGTNSGSAMSSRVKKGALSMWLRGMLHLTIPASR